MTNFVYRQRSDMYVRPGTSDDLVVDEVVEYEALFLAAKPKCVMLDIGANIGSVSRVAGKYGLMVHAYEPDKDNFEMLIENTADFNIYRKNVAVKSYNGMTKFYQPHTTNKGKCSTVSRESNKDNFEEVECVSFMEELIEHRPTLVKIDIEGGEYDLDSYNLPSHIKGLAIEIHLINNDYKAMQGLYKTIKDQFGYVVNPAEDNLKWWHDNISDNDGAQLFIFLRN